MNLIKQPAFVESRGRTIVFENLLDKSAERSRRGRFEVGAWTAAGSHYFHGIRSGGTDEPGKVRESSSGVDCDDNRRLETTNKRSETFNRDTWRRNLTKLTHENVAASRKFSKRSMANG